MEIDDYIRKLLANRGWDTVYNFQLKRGKADSGTVDASIDQLQWQIRITLDTEFEERLKKLAAQADLPAISEPGKAVAYAAVEHEMAHWEYCPADIAYLEMLYRYVSKGLIAGGISENEVKNYVPYVTNMFSDSVINMLHANDKQFVDGLTLFYAFDQYHDTTFSEKFRKPKEDGVVSAMDIFADVQLKFMGNDNGVRELIERKVKDYKKINETSKKMLGMLIGDDLAKKAFEGTLTKEDRNIAFGRLRDEERWRYSSFVYAQALAPYIKDSLKELKKKVPLHGIILKTENDPSLKREIIAAGIERLKKDGKLKTDEEERSSHENFGASDAEFSYADKLEVFDQIYRMKAGEIVVNLLGNRGTSPQLPLFHMKAEPLNGNTLPRAGISWGKTLVIRTEGGRRLELYQKKQPIGIDMQGIENTGSYQDILFIVDVSGSMFYSGRALDGSKYDMCLRTIYAVINYLERIGKARSIRYGAITFSNSTVWSGWKEYSELDGLKRQLFLGYEGGGTVLGQDKVANALSTSKNSFMTIMVSDGEITNGIEASVSLERVMDAKNPLVLFQMMSRDSFGAHLAKKGAMVINIDQPSDLTKITLEITSRKYARRQQLAPDASGQGAGEGRNLNPAQGMARAKSRY